MKKYISKRIILWIIIFLNITIMPYLWFKLETISFIKHKFNSYSNVMILIDAHKTETSTELEYEQSKESVISLLQYELKYTGPLWYRTTFTTGGPDETYCIRITDFENNGDWLIYVSDKQEYSYLQCGDAFGAKFAVNYKVIEYLRELTR